MTRQIKLAVMLSVVFGPGLASRSLGQTAAIYNTQGLAWEEQGRYDLAIRNYNEAIRLQPINSFYHFNRGNAWRHQGQYAQAVDDYNKSISINNGYGPAYSNRGNAWYDLDKYDLAIADFSEAIRLGYDAYYNRASTWFVQERYDLALVDLDEAIRLNDPKTPHYPYILRAEILATASDPEYRNGKRAYDAAVVACRLTGFRDARALEALAAAYAECSDFTHAVEYQEKAQKLYSTDGARRFGNQRLDLYRSRKPFRIGGESNELSGLHAPPPTPSDPPPEDKREATNMDDGL